MSTTQLCERLTATTRRCVGSLSSKVRTQAIRCFGREVGTTTHHRPKGHGKPASMCGIMGGVFGDKRISYGPRSLAGSHRVRAMRGNGENVNATAVEQATEVKDDLSEGYRKPPQSIAKIIDAPSVPAVLPELAAAIPAASVCLGPLPVM